MSPQADVPDQQTRPAESECVDAPVHGPDEGADGLVVARWTCYGKDHLYVTHADGTQLGYWDLETEESHPTAPEYDELVRRAVTGWTSPQETSPQRWPRMVDLFGDASDGSSSDRV